MLKPTDKSASAFRTIGEAAEVIGVPQHVLRFWETRFPELQPMKRGGGRRYYRPADMALLETIRSLLHDQGMTIRGARQLIATSKPGKTIILGAQEAEIDNAAPPPAARPTPTVLAPSSSPQALSPQSRQALIAIRCRLAEALAA